MRVMVKALSNMRSVLFSIFVSGILASEVLLPMRGIAQVTSDGTTNTIVVPDGNNFTVINGTRSGKNLFHSFSKFSVPQQGLVFFSNATDIKNIFSRVTGGDVSQINGLISTNGTTNLFLINPAGIIFGENAVLNVGGSFIASTADRILFEDRTSFSAIEADTPPLLTIAVPIGLQIGTNPGEIQVLGSGHKLNADPTTGTLDVSNRPLGLIAQSNKTLALIGSKVSIQGGNITGFGGHIELGSVGVGETVTLTPSNLGFAFGYDNVTKFEDINITQASSLFNINSGEIQIQGKQINITDGSPVTVSTLDNSQGGSIYVRASESLLAVDSTVNAAPSGLFAVVFGGSTGDGGNIEVETENLRLVDGAQITAATFGQGNAGNVTIQARNIEITGVSSFGSFPTSISTPVVVAEATGDGGNLIINTEVLQVKNGAQIPAYTAGKGNAGSIKIQAQRIEVGSINNDLGLHSYISASVLPTGTGDGGNIVLDTENLSLKDGGQIITSTLGQGDAGDFRITASEIELVGANSNLFASVAQGSTGKGGNLSINTDSLLVTQGAQIAVSTAGAGDAGNLSINASEKIDITGTSANGKIASALTATSASDAAAGSVTLDTNKFDVSNGATVSVSGFGAGGAGDLIVNSNRINLNNQASLQAQVAGESQGNIQIDTQLLELRHNSNITTNATNTANGGNITINSPIIVGLENSDIVANAVEGNGGNINITTQGIFGLQFRSSVTPNNDITASSEFGLNGTVDINNFGIDPSNGVVELPTTLIDSSQQIAKGCSGGVGNSFVITGRGGIPQNPTQQVNINRTWSDIRNLSQYRQSTTKVATNKNQKSNPVTIVEATRLIRNSKGEIELVAGDYPKFPTPVALHSFHALQTQEFTCSS